MAGTGFIKLHRQMLTNDLITSRPDWYMGWVNILLMADHKTGTVCLTEVYRSVKRHFSNDQWRFFVKRLQAEGMIDEVKTSNMGKGKGHRQDAAISNFFKYHPRPSDTQSPDVSHDGVSTVQARSKHGVSTEYNPVLEGENDQTARSKHGASTVQARSKHGVLQEVKELQEDQEPEQVWPEDEAQKAKSSKTAQPSQAPLTSESPAAQVPPEGTPLQTLLGRGAGAFARLSRWPEAQQLLQTLASTIDPELYLGVCRLGEDARVTPEGMAKFLVKVRALIKEGGADTFELALINALDDKSIDNPCGVIFHRCTNPQTYAPSRPVIKDTPPKLSKLEQRRQEVRAQYGR